MLELVSKVASSIKPDAKNILDIGAGAGNNTISILTERPGINCDLVDISVPTLEKAKERISHENAGEVKLYIADFRELDLPSSNYDLVRAAAVLHHLRDDQDWEYTFKKM